MRKSKTIYLDSAASVNPNPSSIHTVGLTARREIEVARGKVATILGARGTDVIFTSGGTESNNLAIMGVLKNFKSPHIVTTNIEHPSVLETVMAQGSFTVVPVESSGIVDPKKIAKAIKKNTVLVSVMYANNEIGTIQPIREIAKAIRHYKKHNKRENIFFHTDAVQAANYLDLNVARLGVDMLTLSGSKILNSGRVGVLYKGVNVPIKNILYGGDQEFGLRPGTEDKDAIVKFANALESAQKIKNSETKRLVKIRDNFISKLVSMKGLVNGDRKNRLPNNISVTFPKLPSDLIVIELSARGIMTSSKSACKSSREEGSYVIEAIRPNLNPQIGGVRFSLGQSTTKAEIMETIKALQDILKKYKKWYN